MHNRTHSFMAWPPVITGYRSMMSALLLMTTGIMIAYEMNAMAAETIGAPSNLTEQHKQHENIMPESDADTTLQQRIEIRKKTKAHWRDAPTGNRASRLKAGHEKTIPDPSASVKTDQTASPTRNVQLR